MVAPKLVIVLAALPYMVQPPLQPAAAALYLGATGSTKRESFE